MKRFTVFTLIAVYMAAVLVGGVPPAAAQPVEPRWRLEGAEWTRVLPPSSPGTAPSPSSADFVVLQMNLCHGGTQNCYHGQAALNEALDVIARYNPDIVTLNEICLADVDQQLWPFHAGRWSGDWAYYVFVPALNKDTGEPTQCTNGDAFGNAVMGHVPDAHYHGVNAWAGKYEAQDGGREQRTFACAYATGDHLACATHLTNVSEPVALQQCQALMFNAVPDIMSYEGATVPTVVGGDFNLEYDPSDPENVQLCVPNGYTRKGDGDVQHILFSNDFHFRNTLKQGMAYTDHPAFMVLLVKP